MTDIDQMFSTGNRTYNTAGDHGYFTIPDGVHFVRIYGCGGGDGGRSGLVSYGYEVPGSGGSGGSGSIPHFAVEAGTTSIPVNPGDIFRVLVGAGGLSNRPGGLTVVTQEFLASGTPPRRFLFGNGSGASTSGGAGAGAGKYKSGSGGNAPDPLRQGQFILGGEGFVTFRGNHDDHWGGAGGGGGAAMGPGGRGGAGGCDGGSQGGYKGGSHDPAFTVAHSGKAGANGQGNGSGGGGGGGPGDGADDHVFDPGGSGGKGGDGYLEITW